jgi:hypothetical protein
VLLDALRAYPKASNSERITFEYVMLKDINDSDEDARRLVKLIAGIPAKINLIPFNEWPGAPYERSDWARIERFADIIYKAGYASPIRTPRGEDIMAACGQLKDPSIGATRNRSFTCRWAFPIPMQKTSPGPGRAGSIRAATSSSMVRRTDSAGHRVATGRPGASRSRTARSRRSIRWSPLAPWSTSWPSRHRHGSSA